MVSKEKYVKENFLIEDHFMTRVYWAVSNSVYRRNSSINRESGLHRTMAGDIPMFFGTIFNGKEYVEVEFLKAYTHDLVRLEVRLFGEDEEFLRKAKSKISQKVDYLLSKEKEF